MPGQQIMLSPATDYPSATDDGPATNATPPADAHAMSTVRLIAVPNWADPRVDETVDEDGGTLVAPREPERCIGGPAPTGGLAAVGSEPGSWPQRFARMVAEALAGTRPARQIMPWTSKRARCQFHRILPEFRSASGQPRIMRVVASYPTLNAIEMSVIAGFGPRTRAFAIRLERLPDEDGSRLARRRPWPDAVMTASGGWVCTDIEAA
jgi:Family of unknown function (DUF6459)